MSLLVAIACEAELTLQSNQAALVNGFAWAVGMMKRWEQCAAGAAMYPCYKCTYPHKDKFCTRDIAHQCLGAHLIGFQAHNRNMMIQFARSTAKTRNLCGDVCDGNQSCSRPRYMTAWHICFNGDLDGYEHRVGPFDIIGRCWDLYRWTGDTSYYTNPDLLRSYRLELDDFVKLNDSWYPGDGVVDGVHSTYCEREGIYPAADNGASDMVACQYAAYRAFARFQDLRGIADSARIWDAKADRLLALYNTTYWDPAKRFYSQGRRNGALMWSYSQEPSWFPLKERMAPADRAADQIAFCVARWDGDDTEPSTYHADVLYPYGMVDKGYDETTLLFTISRGQSNEYPEVSYTAVKHIVQWLMGVSPDAAQHKVATVNSLPSDHGDMWVTVSGVPVGQHRVEVYHRRSSASVQSSRCKHLSGPAVLQ